MSLQFAPAPLPPRPTPPARPAPRTPGRAAARAHAPGPPARAPRPASTARPGRPARRSRPAPTPAPARRARPTSGISATATAGAAALAVAPARQLDPARRPAPRPEPRPAQRHLRVVQPGERTLRRLTPLGGVVLTALLFVVLAGLAGAHSLLAQGQIRLDSIDRSVQEEQAKYQQLRKDVAEAESPERIVSAAEADGMVAPNDLVYLQPSVDDGQRADAGAAAGSSSTADRDADPTTSSSWADVKPLLEAPTP